MGHKRGAAASPAAGTRNDPTRVVQASPAAAAAVAAVVGKTTGIVPAIPVPPRVLRLEKAEEILHETMGRRRPRPQLVGRAAASEAAIVRRSTAERPGWEDEEKGEGEGREVSEETQATATQEAGRPRTAPAPGTGTGTTFLLGTGRKDLPKGAPKGGRGRTRWVVEARCTTTGAAERGGVEVTGKRAWRPGVGVVVVDSRREPTSRAQTVRANLLPRQARVGVGGAMQDGRSEGVAQARVEAATRTLQAQGKEGGQTRRRGMAVAPGPEFRGSEVVKPVQAPTLRATGTTHTPAKRARGLVGVGLGLTDGRGSQIFVMDKPL